MPEAAIAESTLMTLTADIVTSHVANNSLSVQDLPRLIENVHGALAGLGHAFPVAAEPLVPAVSIRASIKPDYLICLEDGKQVKILKRYLMTRFGLTPGDYRAKWGLPADYPMVAPNYSDRRRDLAKSFGLGRKAGVKPAPRKASPTR